jgi:hypothetical protein
LQGSWGTDSGQDDRESKSVEAVELDPLAGPEGGEKSRRLARHWLDQIKKYDAEHKRWRKKAISIEKRYRDQRTQSEDDNLRRANYLWSNTQIFYPAVYGKAPTPVAERKFKDPDPTGRTAATIIERCLRNDIEGRGFHDAMGDSVFDYLVGGRGQSWVRFEPEFGPSVSMPTFSRNDLRDEAGQIEDEDDTPEEEKLEDTDSVLLRESAPVDYVNWDDFGYLPAKARRWSEVRVVFKRVYPSRDEMVKRWGPKIGRRIPLQRGEKERRDNAGESRVTKDERDDKGEVFELWDKDTLSVFWVATAYDWLVNRADDPLELDGFFPCPKPLTMNTTTSTLVPTPLYSQYQDQAAQIDDLTQRINLLTKSVKIAGLYDGSEDAFMRLLDESVENELLPSDQWRRFMDMVKSTSGLGPVWFMPIEQQIKALEVLVQMKKDVVAEMDRIIGLTDVMRGMAEDKRETLGGQRIRKNSGKTRLRQYQDDVAEFCRDTLRIKAEVICKHFRKKTMVEMSGALYDEGFGFSDIANFLASGALDGTPSHPQLPGPQAGPSPQPGAGAMASPPMAGPPGAGPGGPPSPMPPGVPMAGAGAPPGIPSPMGGPLGAAPGAPPPPAGGAPQASPWSRLIQSVLKINNAIDLLRDDITRGFRVDIETDSTIVADEEQDRADANAFIGEVTKFLEMSMQIGAQNPDAVPLLGKLLQFGVRRYRVGRDLEQAIEEYAEKAEQRAKAMAAHPPPNPEMIKAQAKVKEIQLKGQLDQQAAGQELQADKVKAAAEERSRQIDLQIEQMRAANEAQQAKLDMILEHMKLRAETHKVHLDQQAAAMDHQRSQEAGAMEHQRHVYELTHPQPGGGLH